MGYEGLRVELVLRWHRSAVFSFAALMFAGLPSACSASGAQPSAQANGGTGSDAATTTGGAGGGFGAGGTSGSTGGRSNGGTGGVVSNEPSTPFAACQQLIRVQCDRRTECDPTYNLSSCLANLDLCPAFYFSEGATRTVPELDACAGAFEAMSCDDYQLLAYPSCLTRGTKTEGQTCSFITQCEALSCSYPDPGGCGTCDPEPVKGASCSGSGGCQPGEFCNPGPGLCKPVSSLVHAGEGQPCNVTSSATTGAVACSGDLICVDSGSAWTCQHLPSAGQPCALIVTGNRNGCGLDTFCKGDQCVARARVGEPCTIDGSTSPECGLRDLCDPTTHLCESGTDVRGGRPCQTVADCRDGSQCVQGTCTVTQAASCSTGGTGP